MTIIVMCSALNERLWFIKLRGTVDCKNECYGDQEELLSQTSKLYDVKTSRVIWANSQDWKRGHIKGVFLEGMIH